MKKLILLITLVLSINTFANLNSLHRKALNSYKSKNLKDAIKIYEDKGLEDILEEADIEDISDKKLAGILNDYAFFLIKDQQFHKAKPVLDKVIELDDERAVAYYNLAEIYDKVRMEHQARESILIYSYLRGAEKFLQEGENPKVKYNWEVNNKSPKLVKKYASAKDLLDIKTKSFIIDDLKSNNDIYDDATDIPFNFETMEDFKVSIKKTSDYEIPKFNEIKEKLSDLYKKLGKDEKIQDITQKNIDKKLNQIYEYHNSDLAEIYYEYALYLMKEKNTVKAIKTLEKGDELNIKDENYYLKVSELYETLGARRELRITLKKYLILKLLENNSKKSLPSIIYRNLSEQEINLYLNSLDIGYGYIYNETDFEAIKLLIDYKKDDTGLEEAGIYYFVYEEGGISTYEAIKMFSNQELMEHYKKYRKDEFDKINKANRNKVYSQTNSLISKNELLENSERLLNLSNFDEVKKYLKQNGVNNIDDLIFKNIFQSDYLEQFCMNYVKYYLNKGEIEVGLDKLYKIVIYVGNDEEVSFWNKDFYLKAAKLFEKYAYSIGIKTALYKYLILLKDKPRNYPLIIQRNLSKKEIENFGTDRLEIYSRDIPNRYIFTKTDKELIKFIIENKCFEFSVDGIEVNTEKFLREYGNKDLIDYYKKNISEDYEKDSYYTIDEILKRLENEYSDAKPEEFFKFLDNLKKEELIKSYDDKSRVFIANDIPERLEKIYKNLNSKEKIEFLDKINIDYLLDKEIKNHETPYFYNKKLGEFALKYATYLIEIGNGKKAVDILNKTTTIYNSPNQNYYLKAAKIYKKEEQTIEMKKLLKKYLLLNKNKSNKFPKIITENLSNEDIKIFGKKTLSISTFPMFRKDYIGQEDYDLLTLVIDYKNLFSDYTFLINGKKVTIDKFIKTIRKSKELKKYY